MYNLTNSDKTDLLMTAYDPKEFEYVLRDIFTLTMEDFVSEYDTRNPSRIDEVIACIADKVDATRAVLRDFPYMKSDMDRCREAFLTDAITAENLFDAAWYFVDDLVSCVYDAIEQIYKNPTDYILYTLTAKDSEPGGYFTDAIYDEIDKRYK